MQTADRLFVFDSRVKYEDYEFERSDAVKAALSHCCPTEMELRVKYGDYVKVMGNVPINVEIGGAGLLALSR